MKTGKIGRAGKRRKQNPGISPNAFKPVREHGRLMPKTAISLPHDPHDAALALASIMGREFVQSLVAELTSYLKGTDQ